MVFQNKVLENDILNLKDNPGSFNQLALRVFDFQYTTNQLYREFCDALSRTPQVVKDVEQIPYLPIRFFKSHLIKCGDWDPEQVFMSSATTGMSRSKHLVKSLSWYHELAKTTFDLIVGEVECFEHLALLPNYLEQGNSSLISMVQYFMDQTAQTSGFQLDDVADLKKRLIHLAEKGQKTVLWGVSFALLDFVEDHKMNLPDLIIIETGGMKGRRAELTREELHDKIKAGFGVAQVYSEYGMTELFSQAYSTGNGIFKPAPLMKVSVMDLYDPFHQLSDGRTGTINIIDLANLYTCSFIATDDLGRVQDEEGFEVLGRKDNSEIRGCNLMVM